mmetsp:Transcript_31899/g.73295  ORF Transcript_31899/g.73295 Transcript_31899/m.73295 type:complete len:367 (+) Transcript_31899:3-1103(+)
MDSKDASDDDHDMDKDASEDGGKDDGDEGGDGDDKENNKTPADNHSSGLSDLFAPPTHLIHRGGGFQGARAIARDSKRWLLVNLQRDSEFSSHVLNRDVWRDELVENLIREGFVFWQTMDNSPEGQTYSERYAVFQFPHVAIIDPRTGRLLWKKEGWTQENPFNAGAFAEMAMDFCSRHSFDKEPIAPAKPNGTSGRKHAMSEEEQMQVAMAASLKAQDDDDDDEEEDDYVMEDDDDDEDGVQYLGTQEEMETSNAMKQEPEEEAEPKPPSLIETLLSFPVGEEPAGGARIQLRMPDAKRLVRKFTVSDTVKTIYAFVAQNNEEAKGGRTFSLMAGYPPKSLEGEMDKTIEQCNLAGQAITVRWQD